MKVRGAFDYDRVENSIASGVMFDPEEDRAQQQFKDESDVNVIVGRVLRGEPVPVVEARHGDFVGVPDYHTAMTLLVEAQHSFDALPAKLRRRFGNDPGALLDFLGDVDNFDEAVSLGLVEPREEEAENVEGSGSHVESEGAAAEAGGPPAEGAGGDGGAAGGA